MTKYEYRVEHLVMNGSYEQRALLLTDMAADGWRLVAVGSGIYYFEREVVAEQVEEVE